MVYCNSCGRTIPDNASYCDGCGKPVATSTPTSKVRTLGGIVLMIFANLAVAAMVRDIVLALRLQDYLAARSVGAAVYEGLLTTACFLVGWFLLREHLRRKRPRRVLAISGLVMAFWGFMAGFI
jgi:hypothetical protein